MDSGVATGHLGTSAACGTQCPDQDLKVIPDTDITGEKMDNLMVTRLIMM